MLNNQVFISSPKKGNLNKRHKKPTTEQKAFIGKAFMGFNKK